MISARYRGILSKDAQVALAPCLYRMRDTAVVRVSDDFYPRNPSSSHPHIAACAYNGLFLSAIAHVRPCSLGSWVGMILRSSQTLTKSLSQQKPENSVKSLILTP